MERPPSPVPAHWQHLLGRRRQDCPDQPRQGRERVGFLIAVLVPVINALNALLNMTKHPLGNMGRTPARDMSDRAVLRVVSHGSSSAKS